MSLSTRVHNIPRKCFPGLPTKAVFSILMLSLLGWFSRSSSRLPIRPPVSGLKVESTSRPLAFEANQGQVDSRIRFLSRGRGCSLLLTDTEALLKLPVAKSDADQSRSWIRMRQVGANPRSTAKGGDLMAGKSHYFLGSDPRAWRTNVPQYAKVRYEGIYPGVDLIYYGNQGQLEYDYVLAAGVDPGVITLEFEGVDSLGIDSTGNLRIASGSSELCLKKPRVYQWSDGAVRPIQSQYRLSARQLGFQLGDFDPS